jgi:anthranilate phosphoribosyltransferase
MTAATLTFAEVLRAIESSQGLPADLARRAFDAVLGGDWTPVQISAFLVALRIRGETPEVIAAAAESMRAAMVPVEHAFTRVLDTCGTGGDGQGTLNLSTAAAIIVASGGVIVAKHGNRAVSSRAGSADVLEHLGVALGLEPSATAAILKKVGISFMLAPAHHPAMRHAMPVRRELGVRTIFNCLGPLANPARATHQLLGAFSNEIRPVLAQTLKSLGSVRAWVVNGRDGLDEVSPFGPTRVSALSDGRVTEFEVAPEDFGIAPSAPGAVAGGDGSDNARALRAILQNHPHPATDAVILNAAAAFVVAEDMAPKAATDRARQLVANGDALRKLTEWVDASQVAKITAGG